MKVTCPCATGTYQEIVDWLFTQIEADLGTFPTIQTWVKLIQTEVDALFASSPSLCAKKVGAGSIQPVVDEVFAELAAVLSARPVMLGILSFVQNMIDAYIKANNL